MTTHEVLERELNLERRAKSVQDVHAFVSKLAPRAVSAKEVHEATGVSLKLVWYAVRSLEESGVMARIFIDGRAYIILESHRDGAYTEVPLKFTPAVEELYAVFGSRVPEKIIRVEPRNYTQWGDGDDGEYVHPSRAPGKAKRIIKTPLRLRFA